jgi:DnaK suppressor protein
MSQKLNRFREMLEAERAEILSASEDTSGDRKPVELDQQSVGRVSRGDAMQVQAMAKAQDARRAARIMMIDAALKRIEEGDYGYCAECDEEIPERRLEVDPAAPRCIKCAG